MRDGEGGNEPFLVWRIRSSISISLRLQGHRTQWPASIWPARKARKSLEHQALESIIGECNNSSRGLGDLIELIACSIVWFNSSSNACRELCSMRWSPAC